MYQTEEVVVKVLEPGIDSEIESLDGSDAVTYGEASSW